MSHITIAVDRRPSARSGTLSPPEYVAEYRASIGIDSISLNPDSLAKVAMRLAAGPQEC